MKFYYNFWVKMLTTAARLYTILNSATLHSAKLTFTTRKIDRQVILNTFSV